MPKKRHIDSIKTDKVKELLKYPKSIKKSSEELLKEAYNKKLITEKQYLVSLPTKYSVLKSYLYTLITNEFHRSQIEKYVNLYSKFYIRGTYIANLLCTDLFGTFNKKDCIERINLTNDLDDTYTLYTLIEDKNIFKQVFLPERWPTREIPLDGWIGRTRDIYSNILEHLYDVNYKNLMPNTGWDNSLNTMYIKYRANIQNHVMVHLLDNIKTYILKVCHHDNSKILINLFEKKPRPYIMSNEDYEHIIELRNFIGVNRYNCIDKFIKWGYKFFDLHIKLIKTGCINSIYLPLATLTRKYAYIDTKIAHNLFNEKSIKNIKDKHLTEILNLTYEHIKSIKKQKRKTISRRKNKKKNGTGIGIPKFSNIVSIETDGVGLSIKLESAIKERVDFNEETIKEEKLNDPVFVGIDTGRAKIFTASILNNNIDPIEKVVYTRTKYYHEIKNRIRKNIILNKLKNDHELQTIQNDLSLDDGKKDIAIYINKQSIYSDKLLNEYLISKEYALWRMRLFRLRNKSRDNAVRKIVEKAGKNRPIVIGMGDAGFSSNSTGEQSVPTTSILRSFIKLKFIHHQPIKIISIDEFKTSKVCSNCHAEVVDKPISGSQLRKPFCKECNTRHQQQIIDFGDHRTIGYNCSCGNVITLKKFASSRRIKQCNSQVCNGACRDRDIMASRNILQCLVDKYYERPRLECFCRKEN